MKPTFLAVLIFCAFSCLLSAQKITTFEVETPLATQNVYVPMSVNLDNITFLPESELTLVENNIAIPFQIKQGENRVLHWLIQPNQQKKRTFQLNKGKSPVFNTIKATTNNGELTIQSNQKNLLRYNYKTVYPPTGIDTAYKRSGFIHPLWSPHGQVLTRIQAPDHYHHYGIWNPWTHVLFERDTIDFWNLKDKKGTVRFANFAATTNGNVFSEYETLHEHVVFKKDGSKKVALNELQTVRVYQPSEKDDYYILDFTIKLNCASESPVTLLTYRYGSLGWRATEYWNKDNSEVLTSEGKARKAADNSTARWCIVQGALGEKEYGGAVMLSYPANFNHPEPLRIWPETINGRGDMYANFSPTKDKDWQLEAGKTYVLKYRWVVFNDKLSKEKAESAWQYFAKLPKVKVR
jgi:Methane oxygenase PmoA